MKHHSELNAHINTIVGNNLIDTSDFAATIEVLRRQHDLINSEYEEMVAGVAANDVNEIRDGLGDVIVTVDGMYHRLGLEYPRYDLWDKSGYTIDELIVMIGADLEILREFTQAADYGNSKGFFLHKVKTQCDAILWAVYMLGKLWGVDLQADQEAIYASNMSKFDTDIEVARKGIEKYAALAVDTAVVPNEINGLTYHVIKCVATSVGTDGKKYSIGKFLKSIYFKEPVLVPLPAGAPLYEQCGVALV